MNRLKREDGFSVAEVVISVAILFFVLTAIVGLMGASSQMSVQAKQNTVLINVVSSEIESLRAMPFNEVASDEVQRQINGVTVNVTLVVSPVGEQYKRVAITANGIMQGQVQEYSTTVVIRNPDNNMTLQTDPEAPQIEFLADAIPEDTVVFNSETLAGNAAILKTKAYSPSGQITEVRYQVAGDVLMQANGSPAVFTPASNPYYASPVWNSNTANMIDGFQTVIVTAVDDQSRTSTARRRFIVDNAASEKPGVPTGTALDSLNVQLSWPAARDGGAGADPASWYWASQYQYTLFREPLSGGSSNPALWPVAVTGVKVAGASVAEAIRNAGPVVADVAVDAGGDALSRATKPFSRFFMRIHSGRPRGIGTLYEDGTTLVVSKPEMICDASAWSTVKTPAGKTSGKYNYTLSLKVTKPNFPFTGTPTYAVQYRLKGSTTWSSATLTGLSVTNGTDYSTITATHAMSKLDVNEYRVSVSGITPNGYSGGTALPQTYTNYGSMPAAALNTTYNLTGSWGM